MLTCARQVAHHMATSTKHNDEDFWEDECMAMEVLVEQYGPWTDQNANLTFGIWKRPDARNKDWVLLNRAPVEVLGSGQDELVAD